MKASLVIFLLQTLSLLVCSTWIKEMENEDLFEGDIILDPDQKHSNGSVKYGSPMIGGRWPNPVPYAFTRDMKRQHTGVRVIKEAIMQYHKYTCIRFKERTNEKSYILFDWAPGCASPVGHRPHKVSRINLDAPCWVLGTVMHEIGHSLGLWHEQSRPDRDDYVEILWENIAVQHKHNFQKRTTKEVDTFGTPYDFASMMHYGTTAFSNFGDRTIKPRDYSKRLLIGQRRGFSDMDVKVLNLMYKCPVFKGTVPPKICKDTGKYDCSHFKKQGYCHTLKRETWMYRDCCKTCFGHVAGEVGESKTWPPVPKRRTDPVQPTQPSKCVDKKDKKTCEYWARLGNCTTSLGALRKFVLENCCATCRAHRHR